MVTDALRITRAVALLCVALLVSGCGVGYYAQAARGQLSLLRARQPIARLVEAPDTPATLRERLRQVSEIRDFASRELGLPDNASYRSYADLKRPYVVWNVVAAPALSLRPREWCFPVAGCVAYRGYFSEAAARTFAARLAARGDDVAVFGVAAYSTLGRFADPVLNTMTNYGTFDLAAVIFHELAHQQLYLPGDSAFNEAFASTVEEVGLARYAERHATEAQLATRRRQRERGREVSRAMNAGRDELRALYASPLPDDEKRQRRQQIFASTATRIRDLEKQGGFRSGLHEWLDAGLNNAHFAAVATYREQQPLFEKLLADSKGDLRAFYARAARGLADERRMARRGPPQRWGGGPHPPLQ